MEREATSILFPRSLIVICLFLHLPFFAAWNPNCYYCRYSYWIELKLPFHPLVHPLHCLPLCSPRRDLSSTHYTHKSNSCSGPHSYTTHDTPSLLFRDLDLHSPNSQSLTHQLLTNITHNYDYRHFCRSHTVYQTRPDSYFWTERTDTYPYTVLYTLTTTDFFRLSPSPWSSLLLFDIEPVGSLSAFPALVDLLSSTLHTLAAWHRRNESLSRSFPFPSPSRSCDSQVVHHLRLQHHLHPKRLLLFRSLSRI